MPRPSKGPRLYADRARGQWIIRDGTSFRRTGCALADRRGADEALQAYLAEKLDLPQRVSRPSELDVATALVAYHRERGPQVKATETLGYCIKALTPFWLGKLLTDVRAATCREYADYRRNSGIADGTIRRELTTLSAAINHWHAEHGPLDSIPVVTMPDKPPPRERWLTRTEAAELLLGALGWQALACDLKSRRPTMWKRSPEASQHRHVARFVLLLLRTGTRHEAALALAWMPQTSGGWIDLNREVLYRRGEGDAETKKRRTPTRISRRLLPHLRRWAAADAKAGVSYVVNFRGKRLQKLRTGWDRAREFAGLGEDVTPHILRHTRATWLMHEGVPIAEAAGSLGMSVATFERVYGHHHPDFQKNAARI